MTARDTTPRPCGHWGDGHGYCGTPVGVRMFLIGPRCPDHTPAAVAGRPEVTPDPAATLAGLRASAGADPDRPFTPAGDTVVDQRAIASGKRRSRPEDYRAAQEATR